MDPQLMTIVIIAIVIMSGIYYVTHQEPIQNTGNVELDGGEETNGNLTDSNSNSNSKSFDPEKQNEPQRGAQMNPIKRNTDVLPYPQISNNYAPIGADINGQYGIDTGAQPKLDCFPQDVLKPSELMPQNDPNNAWQESSPNVNGHLADRNFLESGHHYGIDTVSNTLKNANHQLRTDPIIPQVQVSPWMQSTTGPDTNRRQFEIGGDY